MILFLHHVPNGPNGVIGHDARRHVELANEVDHAAACIMETAKEIHLKLKTGTFPELE